MTVDIEPLDWVEAVRLERWKRAAALIDALPEQDRSRPEVRYVRARVAFALKDYARTLTLLEELDKQLALLASDIGHYRAEAQLHAGQEKEAVQYFARRSSVRALTKAAIAWSRANQPSQARAAIDRAIRLAKKRTDQAVIEARQLRAKLAEKAGDQAVAIMDLRFVARHASDPHDAEQASARLEKLAPKQRLTSREHMARARYHARRGHTEQTDKEIERAVKAPGGPPSKVDQLLARARALYKSRSDYAGAAQAYEQAAQLPGGHVPQCMYFAAKAWSRANDNERGLELYARLIKKYPRSPWSERASYYAPRLRRLQAQWALAAKGYTAYAKRYPKGQFADEIAYELALCQLLAGKHDDARQRFIRLARVADESLDATSYRYLAAVAAHGAGKSKEAVSAWRSIIESQPLSWFSLVSAARMASVGETPPPPIPPPFKRAAQPLNVKLPAAVRLLRDIGLDRDAERLLITLEGPIGRAYGDRGGEALCQAYQQLHTGARLHRIGQRHVPVRLVLLARSSATNWAWDCLYPRPYKGMVERLETRDRIPPGLLFGVMRQESAFNPEARSPVGARGLMQLMPATASKTARRMSLEIDDDVTCPGLNLELGSHYLGMLLQIMKGSVPLAVGSYNAGPIAVGRWLERTGDVPLDLWAALVPYRETRRYIWRVVGNWARYRYVEQGEAGIPALDLQLPSGISVPDDAY
ncbi:MAG: transglycosylase SLT domain-containing protein [Myxococcota bacterium]